MPIIKQLDATVYNQISAGEVVDSPRSVVKELVENAIDAGGGQISIEIEDGGIKSITVSDDGCGMDEEDLERCVLPHATSKLSSADDLFQVSTLGFRGEALASIAAVSEVAIRSKYRESEEAAFILVRGGTILRKGAVSHSVGTSITILSLFYNTPARFKFLKTPKSEESSITRLIASLILANPNIAFTYIADGKTVFSSTGNGLRDAIFAVMTADTATNMIPIEISKNGYTVTGFAAIPSTAAIKNNRLEQTFIVNGRVIEDAGLSSSCQNSYGESLMRRCFPALVVDITMPFDLVDVNVHPNKSQVRFADKSVVYGLAYHAIKNALEASDKAKYESYFTAEVKPAPEAGPFKRAEIEENCNFDGILPESVPIERESSPIYQQAASFYFHDSADLAEDKEDFGQAVAAEKTYESGSFIESVDTLSFKIIGQAFDTYLLIEHQGKLIIVDQHAAHERILYDKLMNQKSAFAQELLIPFDVEIDEKQYAALKESLAYVKKLGFDMTLQKDRAIISAVPALLSDINLSAFLEELTRGGGDIIKEKIAKTACKNAIKGGLRLTDAQVAYVIQYFFDNKMPLNCPHGRPTVVVLTSADLEKMFGRIV